MRGSSHPSPINHHPPTLLPSCIPTIPSSMTWHGHFYDETLVFKLLSFLLLLSLFHFHFHPILSTLSTLIAHRSSIYLFPCLAQLQLASTPTSLPHHLAPRYESTGFRSHLHYTNSAKYSIFFTFNLGCSASLSLHHGPPKFV